MTRFFTYLASALLSAACLLAAEDDGALARFQSGARDIATLSEVLPLMADAERRAAIRDEIG